MRQPASLPSLPLPPFRRTGLDDVGLSRNDLTALLAAGSVLQPMTGVYLDARSVGDDAARAQALGLVLPAGAVAARGLAAWLHGFDPRAPHERDRPLAMECVVDPAAGTRVPDRRGLVTHLDRLTDGDVTVVHGVPVTILDRTAVDVARFLAPHIGQAVVDAMAHAELVRAPDLLPRLDEWPPRLGAPPACGGRWMARGRRCLTLCEPLTESYGESWTRRRILDAGFPPPRAQIWVPERRCGASRLDLGWEEVRKAMEFDGEEDHSEDDDQAHDNERRDRLQRDHGWTVWAARKEDVLGWDMRVERAVGELLSLEPKIRRRTW